MAIYLVVMVNINDTQQVTDKTRKGFQKTNSCVYKIAQYSY